jgi:hypothetical protein
MPVISLCCEINEEKANGGQESEERDVPCFEIMLSVGE